MLQNDPSNEKGRLGLHLPTVVAVVLATRGILRTRSFFSLVVANYLIPCQVEVQGSPDQVMV